MLKVSHFAAETEFGPSAVPLFGPSDSVFEKVASPTLLPEVVKYIGSLSPKLHSQYVLVNAMGAGEYYGSNINGDHFPEASLIHKPDDWAGVPLIDKIKSKNWTYGFPTFYNAHPFAHHRNKDSSRAFGEVELACWNPHMRRVELVVRVDFEKCQQFGGTAVWDKLKAGNYPDVSMGTKVPFDTCSICLDWDEYGKALLSFSMKKHRHPGLAILEYHKKKKAKDGIGIRGLSVTRKDYCEHAKTMMNRIFADGRKVWVYNDYPRFFDISFVFIGADKTAKVMVFLYRNGQVFRIKPSAEVADDLGVSEPDSRDETEKTASVKELAIKEAFLGKDAATKKGEIDKRVVPSQFAGKAVPILTKRETDFSPKMLNSMCKLPLASILSTLTGMGMVLRPKEFQRITLIQMGSRKLADDLDDLGITFPKVDEEDSVKMDEEDFSPSLARILAPMMSERSALGPVIERRVVVLAGRPEKSKKSPSSLPDELLRKMGAAYNGYRTGVMNLVAHAQPLLSESTDELQKLASTPADDLFTPLSAAYLQHAFLDELPVGITGAGVVEDSSQASASVERGSTP